MRSEAMRVLEMAMALRVGKRGFGLYLRMGGMVYEMRERCVSYL